eukprot:TRINITY_DN198_c0_g1_i1.p1 TRINITY_DN198_c0_g1~~TRINITY_DN198_c0_g1_i1.p1  ORF type:complete len:1150 (-),score=81.84 TRINITY_DN198_c0_g1_i1:5609-9058(-)
MNTEETAKLVSLLDKIKTKGLSVSEIAILLDQCSLPKAALILYYMCKYLYPESAEEIQKWTQSQENTSYGQEELLQKLSADAFAAAVEFGLYDIAYFIALVNKPTASPTTLYQLFENQEYGLIRTLINNELFPNSTEQHNNAKGAQSFLNYNKSKEKAPDLAEFALRNNISLTEVQNLYGTYEDLEDITGINSCLARGEEGKALSLLPHSLSTVTDKSLLLAINTGCLEYAAEFAGRNIQLGDNCARIFSLLIRKISKDISNEIGNLDIYLYILRKYVHYTELQEAIKFADAVDLILNSSEFTNCIAELLNPIKFIVQLVEIGIHLAARFDNMRMRFEQLKEDLIKLGLYILEEVKSVQQMKFILLDKDLESRETLGLISKYYLIELLNNTMAEEISNEVWYGPYNYTNNVFASTSSLWEIVMQSELHEEEDIDKKIKESLFNKDVKSMQAHQFEFSVWRNSAGLHVFFSVFEYILVTVGIFTSELSINNAYNSMEVVKTSAKGRELTPEEYAEYYHSVILARNWIFSWYTVALLILTSSARIFTHPLFQYLTGRGQKMFNLQWGVNLVLFLTLLTMYLPYMGEATLGIQHIRVEGEELIRLAEDIKNNPYISILSAIVAFCLGIRIAYALRYTDFFGPLISVMGVMIRKVMDFGVLYFIVLFVFSLAASLLFSPENEGFERIDYIIITLFQSSFGEFELNPPDKYSVQAKVFYVVFVFVINIMLLNFVIAILNEVYASIAGKSYATLYNEVITLRDQYKPHKTYQFMIHSYLIFDVLLCILILPFYPCLHPDTRKSLNSKLLYLEYTFCYMVVLPVFIAVEIILLPICYVVLLANKVKLLMKEGNRESFGQRLGGMLLFLVFGLLILLLYMVMDIYYFTLHAYTHQPTRKADKEVDDYVYIENLKAVANHLKCCTEEDLPCDIVVSGVERVLLKSVIPGMKQNMVEYITQIAQFSAISQCIKQFSNIDIKKNYVNTKFLYNFFHRFIRFNTLKLRTKQGFAKVSNPGATVIPSNHVSVTVSVSQDLFINSGTSIENNDAHKKVSVIGLKYCDKRAYQEGVKKYCARDTTGTAMPIETQKVVKHLKFLHAAISRNEENCQMTLIAIQQLQEMHLNKNKRDQQSRRIQRIHITNNKDSKGNIILIKILQV